MPSSIPIFLYCNFDIQALCSLASSLRRGISCTCDENQHPASGGFNWAVFISFEDGVQWVLRSPHTSTCAIIPIELSSKLLASEAATLKYLKSNSDIPVPDVYSYSNTTDNDIGVPYILMSKASGWPLGKAWKPLVSGDPELAVEHKTKVLSQLGSITWKLSRLRFSQIGSLYEDNGTFRVDECLSRGHILHDRHSLEDVPRGPFASEEQFYESLTAAFTQHAEILPLSHHCFFAPVPSYQDYQSYEQYRRACDLWNDFVTVGGKIDSSDNRLDYIIAGDALQDMINQWRSRLPKAIPESFPLYHADLNVNNIYVDDDYNITCIIDWAFSSSVPESLLLVPPEMQQSQDELEKKLVAAFNSGFTAAMRSADPVDMDSNGTKNCLELLENSRCAWLLTRLLSFDSIDDYNLFASIWRIVYGSEQDIGVYFGGKRSSPHYMKYYNDVLLDDMPIQETQKTERKYFRNNDLKVSIARKLTVMSQWKSQYVASHHRTLRREGELFVADSRLWKWILTCGGVERSAGMNHLP